MATDRKTLIDMMESRNLDRLDSFKEPVVWKKFTQDDRLLLARLLVMQGTLQLAQGSILAFESFDCAAQVSSQSAEILYSQGCALSSYRENIRCLMLASHAFARVLSQHPFFFDGWYSRARVLTDIGLFEEESSYFIDANQCFEKGLALLKASSDGSSKERNLLCKDEEREIQVAENIGNFFWKWGFCLYSLGKISGEPHDFHQAAEKYCEAESQGCHNSQFFIEYGNCLVELGALLEKSDYFTQAHLQFERAVNQECESFDGWYHLALCLQNLAELKGDVKLLDLADQNFAKAAEINPLSSQLWQKWGFLELTRAKFYRDREKLIESLSKFAKADELEPGDPQILSGWAESELYLGALDENLEYLESARIKILNSLKIQSEDPNTWYLYGSCLNEIGRYFSDEKFFYQAIEKFKWGLSLTRRHPLLWYGLGLAHSALGEIKDQPDLLEKATGNFSRFIECGGESFSQFWNDWGVVLLKLGEMTHRISLIEAAIEHFERSLQQSVINVEDGEFDLEWIYNYGCALDLIGDLNEDPRHFEKAVKIFQQILQLDPLFHPARYSLALALSHLGEALFDIDIYQKAIEQFQILLEYDTEDDQVLLDFGMSLTNLGLLVHDPLHQERSQSLYCQAEVHLIQAAAMGNTQAYYQLAGLYSIAGHHDVAMQYLERARSCESLPGIEDLLHDDWLEALREKPSFRQFINELSTPKSMDE